MNKDLDIAVTLNTDEANEKLDALTAKAQALSDLFTSIADLFMRPCGMKRDMDSRSSDF